jgi:hypothetical protein
MQINEARESLQVKQIADLIGRQVQDQVLQDF